MSKVEQIAYLLKSGEWKSFECIRCNCSLNEDEIEEVLDFLNQYDFLERNNDTDTFRLAPRLVTLLKVR